MTRKNGPAPTAPRITAECRRHGRTLHAVYQFEGQAKKRCLQCKASRRAEERSMKKSQVRYEHVKRRRGARKDRAPGIAAYTKGETLVRSCRVCGCTDRDCRTCVLRTGAPCTWVAKDLCSACVIA